MRPPDATRAQAAIPHQMMTPSRMVTRYFGVARCPNPVRRSILMIFVTLRRFRGVLGCNCKVFCFEGFARAFRTRRIPGSVLTWLVIQSVRYEEWYGNCLCHFLRPRTRCLRVCCAGLLEPF